jgi:hypothetical protein
LGEWLGLTADANVEASDVQSAFLAEARSLLERLDPVRARNSWAALLEEGLVLVIPLDRASGWPLQRRGSLHISLQLMMRNWAERPQIAGAWHEAHYAWDYEPKRLDFEVAGQGTAARSQALDWLATQLQRPIVRDDWLLFSRALCSRWRHADAGYGGELHGFFPLGLILPRRPARSRPAGFFAPW